MAAIPPPQGMSEADYDTIEAAVAETVRGRWFLGEFARRNRLAETRQLLEAMTRLETAVMEGASALPSVDPSIRLLIQRIKEIAGQLGGLASEMRNAGVDVRYVDAVDSQARAVAGMMRGAAPARPVLPGNVSPTGHSGRPTPAFKIPRQSAEIPSAQDGTPPANREIPAPQATAEEARNPPPDKSRLAALSRFDGMTFAEKLALFT